MACQLGFGTTVPSGTPVFSESDFTDFGDLDLTDFDMPDFDGSWVLGSPSAAMVAPEEPLDGPNVVNAAPLLQSSIYGDVAEYHCPQDQIDSQQPISMGGVMHHDQAFVPPNTYPGIHLKPANPGSFIQEHSSKWFPVSMNGAEGSDLHTVSESQAHADLSGMASSSEAEKESPDSRVVNIQQKRESTPTPKRPVPKAQSDKEAAKVRKQKNLLLTKPNVRYTPNTSYTQYSYPSNDWGCFHYSANGELDPSRLYTAEEINNFIWDHPLHQRSSDLRHSALALRIQRNAPDSRARYPTTHSHRCRFAECPMYPNNTINQGHFAVSIDDISATHPNHDPFLVAAYVHLYCLERFTDFPRICARLNIRPDKRILPNEPKVRNPFSLSTSAEEKCVSNFIRACQTGCLPSDYPRFDMPDRRHEGTLTHRLACTKLNKEPRAVRNQREMREKAAGYVGSTLSVHLGDLAVEAEMRLSTRIHSNQNQLVAKPKLPRVYRSNQANRDEDRSDEGTDDDDDDDDGGSDREVEYEENEPRAWHAASKEPTLTRKPNCQPRPKKKEEKQEVELTRGKKRTNDEASTDETASKKVKSSDAVRNDTDEDDEANALEQQKIELELKLIELKRKQMEKAASRARKGDRKMQ